MVNRSSNSFANRRRIRSRWDETVGAPRTRWRRWLKCWRKNELFRSSWNSRCRKRCR